MSKNTLLLLALITFHTGFAQINELKKNADKARDFVSAKNISERKFSKTLMVNTFIGTGGHGHTYPGASAPFGMMQLSPDTRFDGWDGCGGYHYSDSIIYGFSHTHLSGTGVSDYADLLICPQVGKAKTEGKYENPNGYGHRFSHEKETSSPGFYSVDLLDANIQAEFTVDVHSGLHKYTFNGPNENKYILLDLDYRDELISADIETIGKNKLQGHRVSKSWAEEQHFYFYLESNIDWTKAKKINKKGRNKLLLKFPKDTKEIILRVGISAVDTEGAKNNLNAEINGFDFVQQRVKVNRTWEKELSKIYFDTPDKDLTKVFYTSLYHSYLAPNVFSDVDGRYRGMDKLIHQLKDKTDKQYTVFSLWDTFRATHPLFTITQQERTSAFMRTFERMDAQQNDLPVWELAGNETECMIGYHSVSAIADAYTKGITSFDANYLLDAMIRTAKDTTYSKDFYSANGYISLATEPESVSKILEYAYDDFCIARMAKALGRDDVFIEFTERSYNFINHFDPKSKFFRARRGGLWMSPFQPDEVNFNYTEANAWQYSLFAPHAIPTLTNLHGGKSALEKHLDKMFEANSATSGRNQADITGLIGQYAHGNEPSHHMAYLYNYVNRPDKAQLYLDSVLYNLYANAPDGLSGNEDCGQMSSWFVLSSMGLYQVAPGNPIYDIGRPVLTNGKINLENGKTFEIEVKNQSRTNKYVQEVFLNGNKLNRLYITHNEMINGGKLALTMSNNPSEELKKYTNQVQRTFDFNNFTPVPFVKAENRIFEESQVVDFNLPFTQDNPYSVEYKINNGAWTKTDKPLTITESTHIEMRTFNSINGKYSATVPADFVKKNTDLKINLITPFTLPYASTGENALIDGIKGNNEFRTGDWQGFYGFDVKAEIQFTAPKTKFTVELGLLEDLKSWIFYPTAWTVEISTDGKNFEAYKTDKINLSTTTYRPSNIQNVAMEITSADRIKAIRVTVKNSGDCPDWHLGKGNPSWIFLDEISVK